MILALLDETTRRPRRRKAGQKMIDSLNRRVARVLGPAAIAGLAIAVTATAPAAARRSAGPSTRSALTKAVQTSPVGGLNRVPRSHYTVVQARISSVSKRWASAEVTPTARYRSSLQASTVVAVQPAGTSSWVVVDAGSAEVGCGVAPNKVLADLFGAKTSNVCPGGKGIG